MEKVTVESIDNSAIIAIEVSGAFYSDLQFALTHLSQYRSEDEITALIDKINAEEPASNYNEWEIAVRTLLILCAEIESKARKQDAIKQVEVEVTTTAAPNI